MFQDIAVSASKYTEVKVNDAAVLGIGGGQELHTAMLVLGSGSIVKCGTAAGDDTVTVLAGEKWRGYRCLSLHQR